MSVLWESGLEQGSHLVLPAWGWGDSRSPWLTRVPPGQLYAHPCTASRPVNPAQPPAPRPRGHRTGCGSSVYLQSLQPFAIGSTSQDALWEQGRGHPHRFSPAPGLVGTAWPPLLSPESPDQASPRCPTTLQLLFASSEPKLRVQTQGHCTGRKTCQSPDLGHSPDSAPISAL